MGHPHTDVGGPGVLADPGPFPRALLGASLAREHQPNDDFGRDNCGLKSSVSAKSAAALKNSRKGFIRLWSCRGLCGGPSP